VSVCCLYIGACEARKIDTMIYQVEFDITKYCLIKMGEWTQDKCTGLAALMKKPVSILRCAVLSQSLTCLHWIIL